MQSLQRGEPELPLGLVQELHGPESQQSRRQLIAPVAKLRVPRFRRAYAVW